MSDRKRNIDRVIAGLQIFAKHPGAAMNADHDEIYAGAGEAITEEERAALLADGWRWDTQNECWAKFV